MSHHGMHAILGSPRLTANGHETWAAAHAATAQGFRRDAQGCASDGRRVAALLYLAAGHDGAAKGHTFRARELRYDARGGMTEGQASRALAPGATWTLYGEPLTIESNDVNAVRLDHPGRQDGLWVRPSAMTREHGWKLVALAVEPGRDANGGHVPPGGWPSG